MNATTPVRADRGRDVSRRGNDRPVVPSWPTVAAVALGCAAAFGVAAPAAAAPAYVALGDSITFGETDLIYRQSSGDRGYVSRFADTLAARNGGVRPAVTNLAIDGETASSFFTNAGRTPPVVGRGDAPLQLENLNYNNSTALSQSAVFADTVAAQRAMGNTVQTVTITLGFNELAALSTLPTEQALAAIPSTLAQYRANHGAVLDQVRSLAPDADVYLLNYFNPFPGDPTGANPAAPIFAAGGAQLNAAIRDLAARYGAYYVDNFTPFVGREAELTFIDEQPAGFVISGPFGGAEPIGNVHPNERGYDVIAARVAAATRPAAAVPEPSALALLLAGLSAVGASRRRRAAAPA